MPRKRKKKKMNAEHESAANRVSRRLTQLAETAEAYSERGQDEGIAFEAELYQALALLVNRTAGRIADILPEKHPKDWNECTSRTGFVLAYRPGQRKGSRVVQQFHMNGRLIAEFASVKEAGEAVSRSQALIGQVCNGSQPQTAGFVFRYKTA